MKKNLIFFLYHLGLSNYSLSRLFRHYEIRDIEKISTGDFLEYAMRDELFLTKDIDLLSNQKKIKEKKLESEDYLEKFRKNNISFYFFYEPEYPIRLRNIDFPPFILFTKGNVEILNKKQLVSIVGSRNISHSTYKEIESIVYDLVQSNFITVSGLAFGTDILVHKRTYEKQGKTIAVLPSSILDIQPKSHRKDASSIVESNGLIISEYYDDRKFDKKHYVNRNRIISGLSDYLIVTECEEKSGTMHTARFAWKQSRKIFCLNNKSSGNQKILKSKSASIYTNSKNLV